MNMKKKETERIELEGSVQLHAYMFASVWPN